MARRLTRISSSSHGFSLLELLLSITIFASVMLGVLNLTTTYAEREVARAANKYMESVMAATRQILENPTNFNALYEAAAQNGGGYQLIADEVDSSDNIMNDFTVTSVATGPITIQATRLLNANFGQNSPLRSPVRIILRVADTLPPDETDVRALEIMVVTTTPRPDTLVSKAANEGGYHGGFIRTYNAKASAQAVSSFGSWRVTLSDRLQSTNWYDADLQGSLNTKTQGSYLVYYDYANLADITSDYLYRIDDPSPANELNTMYGPLNMGGNDIVGADDVLVGDGAFGQAYALNDPDVEDDCEGGMFCVVGTAVVKGSASVGGQMTVTGSALIADSANFDNMRVQNGLPLDVITATPPTPRRTLHGAQGLFVVDGDEDSGGGGEFDEVVVTNDAVFEDGVAVGDGTLGIITGTAMTMPADSTFQTGTIGFVVPAHKVSANEINAESFRTLGSLRSGIVQGGDVTISNEPGGTDTNRTGVIDITGVADLQVGSDALPGTSERVLSIPRLNVTKLSVDNFGECGDCPQ